MKVVTAAAIAVVLLVAGTGTGSGKGKPPQFVSRSGTQLLLAGKPYLFTGMNVYNANSDGSCWYQMSSGAVLDTALQSMGAGVKVIRAWFFQRMATVGGVRDWSAFDHTLAVAAARNVKVIPTLANQWPDCEPASGYKDEAWYTGGYTQPDPSGTVSYRAWAAEIAARYKNDPTILAWQLINEAEVKPTADSNTCSVNGATILKAWAADVSGAIKAADPNHLVSLGTIGGGQCGTQGGEYETVHDVSSIDLCEYHDYGSPSTPMPGDQWNGLRVRLGQCNSLHKPLFVGEAGIVPSDVGGYAGRAAAFKAKLEVELGAGIVGYLPWAWSSQGSTPDNYDIDPTDPVLGVLAAALLPDHTCRGPSLVVGAGVHCDILGRTFTSATVKAGGSLRLEQSDVTNAVQASSAAGVELQSASAGGLQISGTTGPVVVNGVNVAGNATFTSNTGGVTLTNNAVGGTLDCSKNTPPPTGSGNTAASKRRQCSGL